MHDEINAPLYDDWVEPKNLDAPPPREGMVQRWIRYAHQGGDDLVNFQTQMRRGWAPRPVSSIPKQYLNFPTVKHDTMGEVVAVGGLVLCEMPEQQALRIRRANRQRAQTLNLAVSDETDRASRIGESRGYARIQRKERITQTKRPPVMAD